jgi:multimeric flavodoxin WrbA
MKVLILMGSPRLDGNTALICRPFMEEMEALGAEVRYLALAGMDIAPCRGCYACQQVSGEYGCPIKDDMYKVVDDIVWADLIVLATPIYAWYCAAPMKNVLDRHYGLNKFYGRGEGSLWAGKRLAILATHGYEREYACGPFETVIRRLCEHSGLVYWGLFSVRHVNDREDFKTEEAVGGAKAFARKLLAEP